MLKVQEIRELIKLIDHSSIDEFTYEHEGTKLKLKKNTPEEIVPVAQPVTKPVVEVSPQPSVTQAPPAAPVVADNSPVITEAPESATSNDLHKITSPMVGTFYLSSSPEADPYVTAGSKVSKDSIVCIIEAMKLFNEIEAEVDGEIVEVLVKNGQLVEFGQPLFLVKPE